MISICKPAITVLMPYYRGREYLEDAIKSIQVQTFCDWELLIVTEKDHDATDILMRLQSEDSRIRILCNPGKQGLAESLNFGIAQAKGTYIARMDADDLAYPERLEKQVAYMETHLECGVCGTWQRHFGSKGEWIHRPPEEHEDIRAALIFNCEMCHSTVMLRKSVIQENQLYYDGAFAAEDYELWLRMIKVTQFHNLPEVLGEYRWNEENITLGKMKLLSEESARLVAGNIEREFQIVVPSAHIPYLNGWKNEIAVTAMRGYQTYRTVLLRECDLLQKMWQKNQQAQMFCAESLRHILVQRWQTVTGCAKYGHSVYSADSVEKMLKKVRFAYFFYLLARCKQEIKGVLQHS